MHSGVLFFLLYELLAPHEFSSLKSDVSFDAGRNTAENAVSIVGRKRKRGYALHNPLILVGRE